MLELTAHVSLSCILAIFYVGTVLYVHCDIFMLFSNSLLINVGHCQQICIAQMVVLLTFFSSCYQYMSKFMQCRFTEYMSDSNGKVIVVCNKNGTKMRGSGVKNILL